MGLFDRYLEVRVRSSDAALPDSVALVITERDLLEQGAYDTLATFFDWALEFGAETVTLYVSVLDEAAIPPLTRSLEDLDAPASIAIRTPETDERADATIQVSIGLGGRAEFARAVRDIAADVEDGQIDPEAIDEAAIEGRLVFPEPPDLLVKTGAERLSDFMIWQTVYSELYFTDVNWRDFRKRDYLRALRDYQRRQRRYGE
ncbi:undecaprenyl diphosphate synthase family protein [Halococcoides cellulosivorans]|uniref:UDP diphosphate synthase n=1 Tax=Halococcoides cellulosivorans TaxID=1679096 RepID=A0A2R4X0G4_9EURY|nr:undecaprenyl diphosphate synthase family protein [Halococcoides cellulosivorans]AWB27288.1 UDP diphosphate synthase [Halococcoides cellulosivorans]